MAIAIDLVWDGGTTDGNPGAGRVRLNAADPRAASMLHVNGVDRHSASLRAIVPQFAAGDVLTVAREAADAQILVWVMGETVHNGDWYQTPVRVRSVVGSFADHDLVRLIRLDDKPVITVDVVTAAPAAPSTIAGAASRTVPEPMTSEPALHEPVPLVPPSAAPQSIVSVEPVIPIDTASLSGPPGHLDDVRSWMEHEVASEFALRARNGADATIRAVSAEALAPEARARGITVEKFAEELILERAERQIAIMAARLRRMQT